MKVDLPAVAGRDEAEAIDSLQADDLPLGGFLVPLHLASPLPDLRLQLATGQVERLVDGGVQIPVDRSQLRRLMMRARLEVTLLGVPARL